MGAKSESIPGMRSGSLVRAGSSLPITAYKHPGTGPGPKHWEFSFLLRPKELFIVIEIEGSYAQVFGQHGSGWLLSDALRVMHEKR